MCTCDVHQLDVRYNTIIDTTSKLRLQSKALQVESKQLRNIEISPYREPKWTKTGINSQKLDHTGEHIIICTSMKHEKTGITCWCNPGLEHRHPRKNWHKF